MKDLANRNIGVLSGIVLVLMLSLSFWAWSQIPAGAEVPIHFDINGNPDQYGSPFLGLFLLPLTALFVVLLLAFIPYIEPRLENLKQSGRAFRATWAVLLIFFAVLHTIIVLSTLQITQINLFEIFFPIAMGTLFLVLGNFMGKVRSNYMFGIRTPWTLSSELSWNKTHRLGGRLMMAVGAITIIMSFFLSIAWVLAFLIGGLFVMMAIVLVYSWVIYRDDPEAVRA